MCHAAVDTRILQIDRSMWVCVDVPLPPICFFLCLPHAVVKETLSLSRVKLNRSYWRRHHFFSARMSAAPTCSGVTTCTSSSRSNKAATALNAIALLFVSPSTSLGAAYLAGLATGFWKSIAEIKKCWKLDKNFKPKMTKKTALVLYHQWLDAVQRTLSRPSR